jgi:hypothetical protein
MYAAIGPDLGRPVTGGLDCLRGLPRDFIHAGITA